MGNLQDKDRTEVIGQTSLLKALYVRRSTHKFHLSTSMICRNYLKISTAYKNQQESSKFIKTSMKKLSGLRQNLQNLKTGQKQEISKSKFSQKLDSFEQKKSLNFIEIENPETLIQKDIKENEEMKSHLSDLGKYIEDLKEIIEENKLKINENNQKAFQLSELVNEIADMKHDYNFISIHHRFLGGKNKRKVRERRGSVILDSYRKTHAHQLLKISKDKEKGLRNKLKELNEKVENQFKRHAEIWETIKEQTKALEEEGNLEKMLELLLMKEEKIKEKMFLLKRKKHLSSVSTYDGQNETSQIVTIDKRIEDLTNYLTKMKNKRYHLSEIPVEFIED